MCHLQHQRVVFIRRMPAQPAASDGVAPKSKIFDQLKSTELRRKIGRGIQIGATAVAVVAVAAGVVALHFTPVGWAILGVAALAVGTTAVAAIVSKVRGGSFWNEVLKPQLKGIGIGLASLVVVIVVGAMAAGGGDVGDLGGGGGGDFFSGPGGFGLGFMLGGGLATGAFNVSPPGDKSQSVRPPVGFLSNQPNIAKEQEIKDAAQGEKITKAGRVYEEDNEKLYNDALKYVARGTKANLERAARRLEVLEERGDGGAVRKLELAEICMMIEKPARAAQLYEEARSENPNSIVIAAKEVRALRLAGKYDAAIALGTAYKEQAENDSNQATGEEKKLLGESIAWHTMQIEKAVGQKQATG